ncbi:hypothetical protein RIF29_34806 [Crotalaria pallida]|uniref:Uncharacterized protein n=1 Tax=Crotalaria pallida TaxID=3830 RepID=A0AAN9HTQ1_CROPI
MLPSFSFSLLIFYSLFNCSLLPCASLLLRRHRSLSSLSLFDAATHCRPPCWSLLALDSGGHLHRCWLLRRSRPLFPLSLVTAATHRFIGYRRPSCRSLLSVSVSWLNFNPLLCCLDYFTYFKF